MAAEQLCWSCAKACGGCSWSAYGVQKPVKYCRYKDYEIEYARKHNGQLCFHKETRRFIVSCPEYVEDERSRKEREAKELARKYTDNTYKKKYKWIRLNVGFKCGLCGMTHFGDPTKICFCKRCGRRMYGVEEVKSK